MKRGPQSGSEAAATAVSTNELRSKALAGFIAADPKSLALLAQIEKIATTQATVLIQGESGAGKDLVASLLHYLGPRPEEPMLKIDCASLPPSLMESELFGYERGAFTGASELKHGRLELASRGTLVLDEVAALSLPMQAKLLRVLEEREFQRLGGTHAIKIPEAVRFVAISNADLAQAVERGEFREDLFYRLNVVPLVVPPLRDRAGDIAALAEHLLGVAAEARQQRTRKLSKSALNALQNYEWPGNVRELRNICERLTLSLESAAEISADELPANIRSGETRKLTLEQLEREYIAEILDYCRGRKSKAAEILGISRKTLLEKRKRYKLD